MCNTVISNIEVMELGFSISFSRSLVEEEVIISVVCDSSNLLELSRHKHIARNKFYYKSHVYVTCTFKFRETYKLADSLLEIRVFFETFCCNDIKKVLVNFLTLHSNLHFHNRII